MQKIGMIGYGRHARQTLLPAATIHNNAQVVAIYDPLNTTNPLPPQVNSFSSSISEVVNAADTSAIIVAATPQVNLEVIKMCHMRQLPIFVEKPLCASASALSEIRKMLNEGLLLAVGHNFSYAPAFQAAKAWLTSSDDPSSILSASLEYVSSKPSGDRWNLGDPTRAMLLTSATHVFDLILMLAGDVRVKYASKAAHDRFLTVSLLVESLSGALFSVTLSNAAPHFSFRLSVLSSDGTRIEVPDTRSCQMEQPGSSRRHLQSWTASTLESSLHLSGYAREMESFLSSLEDSSARNQVLEHTMRALRSTELVEETLRALRS